MTKPRSEEIIQAIADTFECDEYDFEVQSDDVEKIRKDYLKNIKNRTLIDWITETKNGILETISCTPVTDSSQIVIQAETYPYDIKFENTFETIDSQIVLIGRQPQYCHFAIPSISSTQNISRVQCILMQLITADGTPVYAIIDFWSLEGTHIPQIDKKSVPNSRKVLIVPSDTPFNIIIGQITLTINPRMCIACTEVPREIVLSCNHLVFCTSCNDKHFNGNDTCPICRQVVSSLKKAPEQMISNCGYLDEYYENVRNQVNKIEAANNTVTNSSTIQCVQCKEHLSKDKYSKRQWRLKNKGIKCMTCIDSSN